MKLIILYHYSDGYTYWGVETIPVERESEEALIVEMEESAKNDPYGTWGDTGIYNTTILGRDDNCSVEIMTFEKWWASNVI